jgi:hypothetical protein
MNPVDADQEMAEWLAADYQYMGLKNAVRLTVHTMRLIGELKQSL